MYNAQIIVPIAIVKFNQFYHVYYLYVQLIIWYSKLWQNQWPPTWSIFMYLMVRKTIYIKKYQQYVYLCNSYF